MGKRGEFGVRHASRGGVHLILANPPWRQLQERAEKIPGDKKHVEGMLSQSHCVAQFNTAHKLHQLAGRIQNCDGDRFLVNIHADILHAIHTGCSFLGGVGANTQNLLQMGRPFILRRIIGKLKSTWTVSAFISTENIPDMLPLSSLVGQRARMPLLIFSMSNHAEG